MFDRILVPVDGSERSLKALEYAITLAKGFSSEVYIIHIIQVIAATLDGASFLTGSLFPGSMDITSPSFIVDLKNHLEERGRRILSTAEAKAREVGVEAGVTLLYGGPAEEILKFAERMGVDLIVIGDRGLGSVSRFFLGSVCDKVSRHASCPVLIIKT